MLAFIKANALYGIYAFGVAIIIMCFTGRTKFPLYFLVALLPLRNVIDRLHAMPMGKDFVDILFIALIIGWLVNSVVKGHKFFAFSPLNAICIVMIFYLFVSLIQGSFYLNYFNVFDISDPRVQDWKNFAMLPLLYFFVFNNIRDKKGIWKMVVVMCLIMLLMDYYLIQQLRWFASMVSRKKINATF
ncbi:hypothetical protein ACFL49_02165, partial [Candidatus Omnitrophota bacterium]